MKELIMLGLFLSAGWMGYSQETQYYRSLTGEYEKALELFELPDYVNARIAFEELMKKAGESRDERIAEIAVNAEFYRAWSALELLNPDGEKLMLTFIQAHTASARNNMAYFLLGSHYFHRKKFNDAIQYFEKVSSYELGSEEREDYQFRLAYSYFFKKKMDRALPLFARAKQSKKYYYPAHYYHGFILFEKGKYNEALSDFKKVQEDPYFGRVVPYYIASIYYQQGNYDELLKYIPPLLEDKKLKYYPEINQLLGKTWFQKGDYEKALPYLAYYSESSKRMSKEDIYQLAYAQYKLGECEDAIRNFSELAREKDALGQNALYLMGNCYLKMGDKRKARNAFEEAAGLHADPFITENALFNFAKVSFELGIHGTAITSLKEFISKYPDSDKINDARELLTEMFLSTRNYQEAIESIESMGELTPKLKEAYQKVSFYRAVEMFNNRQYGKARQYFKKSLQEAVEPGLQARAYFWLGEIAYQEKKYTEAIGNYNKFLTYAGTLGRLPAETSKAGAYYGIAYSYFKTEKYGSAKSYFSKSWKELQSFGSDPESVKIKNKLYPDVVLRLADCNFMTKNYSEALRQYETAVNRKYPSADYALYQMGVLYGIRKDFDRQVESLQKLVSKYRNSYYYDDGLFQLAGAYLLQKNPNQAIRYFKKLVNESKNSPYRVQALLKLGLIHYNRNEDKEAVKYYKAVVTEYKGSPEAEEALRQIKRIAIDSGNPNLYVDISGASASEQDSILYQSAENVYYKQEWEASIEAFTRYLNRFPDGYFALQAHYYRGDAYYQLKRYKESLPDYEYVIRSGNNKTFAEVAYLRAAKIAHFILKDYDKAFAYYEKLYQAASMRETRFEAIEGLMESAFRTGRLEECKKYSLLLLQNEEADEEQKLRAHYYLARIAFESDDLETALIEFTVVQENAKDEKAAEARYYQALINYRQGLLDEAESICDDIYKNYASYGYWLTRTLILISDIYVEKGDLTQAKFTLESIVKNYKGDDEVLSEAREKLENVNRMIESGSRIKGPEENGFDTENEEK